MERWKRALSPNGILYVDVPDITRIDLSAVVDDHFYDEDLSYFSKAHLEGLGARLGLQITDSMQYGGVLL